MSAQKEERSAAGPRYKQFFQLSTQAMNELQSTKRELTDLLKAPFRNIEQMWKKLAPLQEEKLRTDFRMVRP